MSPFNRTFNQYFLSTTPSPKKLKPKLRVLSPQLEHLKPGTLHPNSCNPTPHDNSSEALRMRDPRRWRIKASTLTYGTSCFRKPWPCRPLTLTGLAVSLSEESLSCYLHNTVAAQSGSCRRRRIREMAMRLRDAPGKLIALASCCMNICATRLRAKAYGSNDKVTPRKFPSDGGPQSSEHPCKARGSPDFLEKASYNMTRLKRRCPLRATCPGFITQSLQ